MTLQGSSAVGNPLTTRTREPPTPNLQDCVVQTSSRKQLTFITKNLLTCKKKKTRKWGSRSRGVEHASDFSIGSFCRRRAGSHRVQMVSCNQCLWLTMRKRENGNFENWSDSRLLLCSRQLGKCAVLIFPQTQAQRRQDSKPEVDRQAFLRQGVRVSLLALFCFGSLVTAELN